MHLSDDLMCRVQPSHGVRWPHRAGECAVIKTV